MWFFSFWGDVYVHRQDTLIPMMMDSRYPVDTLWFILEEDYRFFPEDQDPDFADRYKTRAAKLGEEREQAHNDERAGRRSPGQAPPGSGAYCQDS